MDEEVERIEIEKAKKKSELQSNISNLFLSRLHKTMLKEEKQDNTTPPSTLLKKRMLLNEKRESDMSFSQAKTIKSRKGIMRHITQMQYKSKLSMGAGKPSLNSRARALSTASDKEDILEARKVSLPITSLGNGDLV
jgi:hypothetical protein